ncbi:PAS domain S-box protein [Luteolibacter arcticus]|uniref:histidine kinase n=1 Tax=Luteolibacter arcticus TaxID=1581411 RepID=A0ABT3GDR0_9BACT|nr:PAS domain S-box protein [Luteolibacter arcticus]MCW1921440.1 PAS domain S-box protein [Luteolibacter arcticus]
MSSIQPDIAALMTEISELTARLDETEETLRAIRAGEVDALVVDGSAGPKVFILQTSDSESNRFRSDILSKVTDAVIAIDQDDQVIYLNAAAEEQYGVSASESLGRHLRELFHHEWVSPDDEQAAREALRRTGHWRGEHIHVLHSGETIRVESAVSRLYDDEGNPSGLLSVIRNITDRKLAEVALRDSEERYRTLFESIDEGFCVIEVIFDERGKAVDYRFLQVSPSFEKHTGLSRAEGKRVKELVPNHEDYWFEIYGRVARTGEPARFESQAAGLLRWYDVHASRFGNPELNRVAVIFNDITERKLADDALRANERALAEQAAALRQADRNKDEFLAMLAHELRNPLAPLRNASQILQTPGINGHERTTAQALISRQIDNMSRMIDDLLDVSRITEGKIELKKEPVLLDSILIAAGEGAKFLCEARSQTLAVSLPTEPVYLNADATRLEQVLGNLLGNACKYSGEHSRISLSAERDLTTPEPQVVIRVSDNGIGIDPKLLPRVFELFVQASRTLDRAHGGLGIGLTIVHRLVRLHGGSIEAHSEGPGRGAEFVVRLPIMKGSPATAARFSAAPAPEQPMKLLIVDDNHDGAESMAMLQELLGHQTRLAHTGPDAVTIAQEFLPDVILLDIGLPGMDGYEVARKLRAMPLLAHTLLIALTGYGSDEDRQLAREAGFDEHLAKPADQERLRRLMREHGQRAPAV